MTPLPLNNAYLVDMVKTTVVRIVPPEPLMLFTLIGALRADPWTVEVLVAVTGEPTGAQGGHGHLLHHELVLQLVVQRLRQEASPVCSGLAPLGLWEGGLSDGQIGD